VKYRNPSFSDDHSSHIITSMMSKNIGIYQKGVVWWTF